MSVQAQTETLAFDANVNQLLELVAHSLYSNKEIFLRELISNASDAADKLRYQALSDNALYEGMSDLKIWVDYNKDAKTITIRDNGIGMSREEVMENLGTIAQSGTRAFKDKLVGDQSKDSQLIGQFGVGFYSAFIVSTKVMVKTRKAGMKEDQGVYWESDGKGEYVIKNIDKSVRGTEIILHINEENAEFLEDYRLRQIIRKYSDHILLPIMMKKPETDDDKKKQDDGEVVVQEEEVVNQANALWTLPKSEIKPEQYNELYKHISHDFEDPLLHAHNKVEGSSEYTSLLYIPARAPFDLYDRDQKRGLKLYVKRVFIMDDAEHFMPMYLRFVKGIVDTNDLPLNISRELLQSNATIERIKSSCVKRILSLLEKTAEKDAENYATFWESFGQVLKEGVGEDTTNKHRIAQLLRFSSTHEDTDKQSVTLSDYVSRMKEDQKAIYYVIADSYSSAKHSPLLEVFRKKGVEVLLLSERVDEWVMSNLTEFDGKTFQSISQGELDLGDLDDEDTKKEQEKNEKAYKDVVKTIKEALGERVEDVRLTHRLTDSPACVVFSDQGMSGHMQRMLQAAGQAFPESKPILELNPDHALIAKVKTEKDDARVKQWSQVFLNQALLAEGEQLKDPSLFVKELNQLLVDLT